jgi:hypothetical protein
MATDKGAHFEAKLTPIDGKWQARWTVMLGNISETDVRDFDKPADAWDWIDIEATRRGWRRPDSRPNSAGGLAPAENATPSNDGLYEDVRGSSIPFTTG